MGYKHGGSIGSVSAQSGGGIQSLIDTGTSLIDVMNKGMAMPENIGTTQLQGKLDVNSNNPYIR